MAKLINIVPGLGARKVEFMKQGGTLWDMAIGMQENYNLRPDYPEGDVFPGPAKVRKTHDAACFGVFRQGWGMIRQCVPQYAKLGPSDFAAGHALNVNLHWDIAVRHASQNKWQDAWFAGHRGGAEGLRGDWPQKDIEIYRQALQWIYGRLQSDKKYLTDDTRFGFDESDVPPV